MTETTETIETTDSSRLDKARGLLFGLALGDCLGAPFEGRTDATHADIVTAENAAGPLVHTDDTALALVLAPASGAPACRPWGTDGVDTSTVTCSPWSSPEPGRPNPGAATAAG